MIEVRTEEKTVEVKDFPKLMIEDISNRIVLFFADGKGTILDTGEGYNIELGYYSEDWDMECFTEWNGEIKLKNK